MADSKHKPVIETMINTAALALTSYAVVLLTTQADGWQHIIKGVAIISAGMGLEFFKYFGRKKKFW